MQIRASKLNDYVFEIEPSEYSAIKNTSFAAAIFGNGASVTDSGLTFGVYESVPGRMIKGEIFQEIECGKTRSIISKTDFLTTHGLCVWVASGEIINIGSLIERPDFSITPDHYRFICNHIPQIFYPSEHGVIIGIDGEYDFNSKLFKGSLIFDESENL